MANELTINELRARTGMSQSKFAEYFGIQQRTLQGWEQGKKPPAGMVNLFMRVLDLEAKVDELESELEKLKE